MSIQILFNEHLTPLPDPIKMGVSFLTITWGFMMKKILLSTLAAASIAITSTASAGWFGLSGLQCTGWRR